MHALCAVFDVDHTVYLEREYVHGGFRAVGQWVRRRRRARGFADACWREFLAGRRGDIFDRAAEHIGLDCSADSVSELVLEYRRHVPTIALAGDAEACLTRLDGCCALAAITDGPYASRARKFDALQLRRWCHPVVLTAELGNGMGKPNPASFELVEQSVGLEGTSFFYFGDNPQTSEGLCCPAAARMAYGACAQTRRPARNASRRQRHRRGDSVSGRGHRGNP